MANIFYCLDLIEAYGTGLKRIYETYSNYIKKPQIKNTENTFTIVLYNTNQNSLETNKQKIIEYIKNYGSITRAETEQLVGVKKSLITNILNPFKKLEPKRQICLNPLFIPNRITIRMDLYSLNHI